MLYKSSTEANDCLEKESLVSMKRLTIANYPEVKFFSLVRQQITYFGLLQEGQLPVFLEIVIKDIRIFSLSN